MILESAENWENARNKLPAEQRVFVQQPITVNTVMVGRNMMYILAKFKHAGSDIHQCAVNANRTLATVIECVGALAVVLQVLVSMHSRTGSRRAHTDVRPPNITVKGVLLDLCQLRVAQSRPPRVHGNPWYPEGESE